MRLPMFICCVFLFAMLYGCSHTAHTTPVYPKHEIKQNYELGIVQTAEIGSIMISRYSANVVPGFTPRYEYYPRFQGRHLPPVLPGQEWGAHYKYKDYNLITSKEYNDYGLGFLVDDEGVLRDGRPLISLIVTVDIANPLNRPIPGTYSFGLNIEDRHLFAPAEYGDPKSNYVKSELIYDGIRSGHTCFIYKKYKDQSKEPSVYKESVYSIDDNIIIFDSFEIEIIDADEISIHFIVLNDDRK